jgi:hypothetical protein
MSPPKQSDRQNRLAKALKQNLKRRKSGTAPEKPTAGDPSSQGLGTGARHRTTAGRRHFAVNKSEKRPKA